MLLFFVLLKGHSSVDKTLYFTSSYDETVRCQQFHLNCPGHLICDSMMMIYLSSTICHLLLGIKDQKLTDKLTTYPLLFDFTLPWTLWPPPWSWSWWCWGWGRIMLRSSTRRRRMAERKPRVAMTSLSLSFMLVTVSCRWGSSEHLWPPQRSQFRPHLLSRCHCVAYSQLQL